MVMTVIIVYDLFNAILSLLIPFKEAAKISASEVSWLHWTKKREKKKKDRQFTEWTCTL